MLLSMTNGLACFVEALLVDVVVLLSQGGGGGDQTVQHEINA